MTRFILVPILFALALAGAAVRPAVAGALELVMVEQAGCAWCLRWHAEVGDAYPRTAEGKAAPLRRIDLRAPLPEGVRFARPATFTPTFVLVEDGVEVGRIEGYPGEDFFWPLLARLIAGAGVGPEGTGAAGNG